MTNLSGLVVGRPRRARHLLFVVVVAAAVLAPAVVGTASLGAVPAGARAAGDGDPAGVERVLVISIPTLSWEDLNLAELPYLNTLLDESAIGDLSVRGVRRTTSAGDGYLTMDAGTRARGSVAFDGLAFQVDERYGTSPAEEAFQRRTGRAPQEAIFSLALPAVVERNEDLRFDAQIGALGDALNDAGVERAVIANADRGVPGLEVTYGREAVMGLMDSTGVVPAGRVNEELLVDNPDAAFGRMLNPDAVETAFDTVWNDNSNGTVVLVEASDVVRADAYRPFVAPELRRDFLINALESSDEMIGRLLEQVDPATDAVLVVGPYHAGGRTHLGVAGLWKAGLEPGLLRSASTRRSGFVTTVDIAPTILQLLDIERPSSMEGRPFERGSTGGDAEQRRDFLIEANDAAKFRDSMVTPVAQAFVIANVLLSAFAVLALAYGGRRARRIGAFCALALLGVLPATYLAGAVDFHRYAEGWYWLFLGVVGLGIATVATLIARRWTDALIITLSIVLGLQFFDVVRGAPLQINTVFGYSPTVAGRFAGFGNLAFAQIAGAAVLLAALVANRIGGRRGARVGIGLLVLTLVIVGMPMWGSDVGGVLTLVPTITVMGMLMLGWRIRARTLVWVGAATVAVIGVFAAFDLARPAERRTHLGRLVERIGDDGFQALETVVLRKLGANFSVLTRSVWTLMVPAIVIFLAALVWRSRGRLRAIQDAVPELRAALVGLMIAAGLGFALNDSGIAVPGLMLGVVNGSLVYLVLVVRVREPGDPPRDGVARDDEPVGVGTGP